MVRSLRSGSCAHSQDEMQKPGGYDVEVNLMRMERFEITDFPAGKRKPMGFQVTSVESD